MVQERRVEMGFSVNGKQQRILAIKGRKCGDLIVILNRAQYFREKNLPGFNDSPKIKHQKYSIHQSENSSQEYNTINHIIELNNGKTTKTSQLTHAIKKYKKFAPLFAALSPSLNETRYGMNDDKVEKIILGSHQPQSSLLFYMVLVSEKGLPFVLNENAGIPDISAKTISFEKFDISVIWSFGLGRSGTIGTKIHVMTHMNNDPVRPREEVGWLVDGLDKDKALDFFRHSRQQMHNEYIHIKSLEVHPLNRMEYHNVPFLYTSEDILADQAEDIFTKENIDPFTLRQVIK